MKSSGILSMWGVKSPFTRFAELKNMDRRMTKKQPNTGIFSRNLSMGSIFTYIFKSGLAKLHNIVDSLFTKKTKKTIIEDQERK